MMSFDKLQVIILAILLQFFNRMRKKSFVVIARRAFATKQSDKLLKSLKARLLRYARNDLSVGFSANC